MRWAVLLVCLLPFAADAAAGEARAISVKVSFPQRQGPLAIDRMALGQGGLSEKPMWRSRIAEIRALRPEIIRLFIQE